MKLIISLMIILSSILPLNVSSSKQNEFYENIESNYETYGIIEKVFSLGDLIICKGYVKNQLSVSIYFANGNENNYAVQVSRNNKVYKLTNKRFQIFYQINIKEKDEVIISIVDKVNNESYYSINIDQIKINLNGQGLNKFPYKTTLKNELNIYTVILIAIICLVLVEVFVVIFCLQKKKQKKYRENMPIDVAYESNDYQVDDENESK